MSRTRVAAPAPRPSPDEILESIARLSLRDFTYVRRKLLEMLRDPEPRFRLDDGWREGGIEWYSPE